jgi:hypothetical protein
MGDPMHPFHPQDEHIVPIDPSPGQPAHPALHWGTFVRNEALNDVLSLARGEVEGAGFQILSQPSVQAPLVIGQVPTAIVLVSCATVGDNQTWVMVAATSTDPSTAERYRNLIREQITRAIPI